LLTESITETTIRYSAIVCSDCSHILHDHNKAAHTSVSLQGARQTVTVTLYNTVAGTQTDCDSDTVQYSGRHSDCDNDTVPHSGRHSDRL